MHRRKAQSAGNAAVFILLITILLIMYILFLRPEDRAALLEEGSSGGSSGGGKTSTIENKTLLSQPIGQLDYLKFTKKDHELPSFRIFTSTAGTELRKLDSIFIKSATFGSVEKNVSFEVNKPDQVKNLLLSFNVADSAGELLVYFNGREVFYAHLEEGSPAPIELPTSLLTRDNLLTFKVSSPGWMFWKVNVYSLRNMRVTADITDRSESQATQYFTLTGMEKDNLNTATLFFYPGCTISDVGKLTIDLNGHQVYSSVADCGISNHVELDKNDLFEGSNKLEFETAKGSYLLDQVKVRIELKDLVYPVYYFDMEQKFFSEDRADREELCGMVDGICPDNCDGNEDKDCCFKESRDNYWCDIETSNTNDRCVEYVDAADCLRCPSGYEDKSGDMAENCEGLCGDDNDKICPSGCSKYYDKDCCYGENKAFFWCDDVPIAGLSSVCEDGVSSYECDDCAGGYVDGNGHRPQCKKEDPELETEEELNGNYDVTLNLRFVNENIKKLDVVVNGYRIYVDTNKLEYSYNIDDYVRSGTNSIELVPKSENINIADLIVEIDD